MRLIGRILIVFLAAIGLLTMLGVGTAVWLVASRSTPTVPERIVLTLDLDRGVTERVPPGALGRFQLGGAYPLRDILDALEQAAKDPRVTAVLVRANDADLRMAQVQELREAIGAFRRSGKPAVLFSESMGGAGNGTLTYYLAAAFKEIWLQPSGDVAIAGFSVESPFLRGVMEELRIQPQFGARYEYKSAIEIFTEDGFTEPSRQSLQALLTAFSGQFVEAVAADRRIDPERVRALMDKAPLLADEALNEKLVDRLAYWDEAERALKVEEDDLMDARDYLDLAGRPHDKGTKIALIYGVGTVQSRQDDAGPLGGHALAADRVGKALREAAEDAEVKAILLRIDSPGGSYVASDTLWRAVHHARSKGKPVVVSMGAVAASGGYFIAMAGDRVIANPGTITGSIGVFGGKLVLKEFWEKLGINWDQVSVGANAGMWSANQPFSEATWARLQLQLDRVYADFTGKAAEARGLDAPAIDAVARGRIWSGADAKRVGLVDETGGFATALKAVREVAGVAADAPLQLTDFPRRKGALGELLEALRTGDLPEVQALAAAASTLTRLTAVLAPLLRQMEAVGAPQGELQAPFPLPTSAQ